MQIGADKFRAVQEAAVAEALLDESIRLDVVIDGDIRRDTW